MAGNALRLVISISASADSALRPCDLPLHHLQPKFGDRDAEKISTSYVERQNLTVRMAMRRFTRLTNAFSKKLTYLKAALSLHFAWYDWVRVHQTLRVTPAMQAGISNRVWKWPDPVLADCHALLGSNDKDRGGQKRRTVQPCGQRKQ
jgi:hypothetical protein